MRMPKSFYRCMGRDTASWCELLCRARVRWLLFSIFTTFCDLQYSRCIRPRGMVKNQEFNGVGFYHDYNF